MAAWWKVLKIKICAVTAPDALEHECGMSAVTNVYMYSVLYSVKWQYR